MKLYYVYILCNVTNSVLYVGVSNDIERRILEHKSGKGGKFTSKYRCTKLVWYEEYQSIESAIETEKYMKGKSRAWKNALINQCNPDWNELFKEGFGYRPY